jgi:hypothetical protein
LKATPAANEQNILKMDLKQAYLYCKMGDEVLNIRPPDCYPEPILEGHILLLVKAFTELSKPLRGSIMIW